MEEFVSAVLSPAKVNSVELLEDGETARVLVDESQLSLAIGKAVKMQDLPQIDGNESGH